MKRVIIVGSPRSKGRSAHLAEMLFEANIDERPEDELFLVPVSEIEVGPCIGCNACRAKSEVVYKDGDGSEVTEQRHRCVFDDDMQTLYDLLDDADALTIVCPVYFSGTPAPMKCLLDRLQPYFWDYCENGPRMPKRPLELHIVGEGGDPHGFAPLVSEVKGTTALAGFGLERILSWVGKISPEGEILSEAEEVPVPPRGAYAAFVIPDAPSADAKTAMAPDSGAVRQDGGLEKPSAKGQGRPRPKLDLSQGKAQRESARAKGAETQARGEGARAKGAGAQAQKDAAKPKGPAAKSQKGGVRSANADARASKAGAKQKNASSQARKRAKGGHRG